MEVIDALPFEYDGLAGAEIIAPSGPVPVPQNAAVIDRVETIARRGPAISIDFQWTGIGDDTSSLDLPGAGPEDH